MLKKLKEKIGNYDLESVIVGIVIGVIITALLATGAPDIASASGELIKE